MGEGKAAEQPQTMVQAFDQVVANFGDQPALHQKVLAHVSIVLLFCNAIASQVNILTFAQQGTSAADTPWTTWTWKEYRQSVDGFGKALISIGFNKFDTVNIIGFNAPEWHFANFGAIVAGGIAAGLYTTNGPEANKYVSKHSEAKVVIVEGVKQLEKYYSIAKDLPNLKALVMYGPDAVPADVKSKVSVPVYKFDEFVKIGASISDAELKARGDDQKPNDVTTLIYTSGTTGPPKAVMITHDNITWTAKAQLSTSARPWDNDDAMISYLPLSHIAAQMLDMHCPMMTGLQVWFAQSDALRGSLGATLKEVRPTVFFGVPRVWEKIYDKMQEVAKSTTGIKKIISTWAKKKSTKYWVNHQYGGNMKKPFMYGLSAKLLGKVKLALGLDRVSCYEVHITYTFVQFI